VSQRCQRFGFALSALAQQSPKKWLAAQPAQPTTITATAEAGVAEPAPAPALPQLVLVPDLGLCPVSANKR